MLSLAPKLLQPIPRPYLFFGVPLTVFDPPKRSARHTRLELRACWHEKTCLLDLGKGEGLCLMQTTSFFMAALKKVVSKNCFLKKGLRNPFCIKNMLPIILIMGIFFILMTMYIDKSHFIILQDYMDPRI